MTYNGGNSCPQAWITAAIKVGGPLALTFYRI
jgi:hypothetical protein